MMKFIRKNLKYSIWLLVAAFLVGSGISLSGMKKEARFAGEVFGKPVTFQEYNQFYRATQLFMPSEKPIDDPELLRNFTWQNITYSREAKRKDVKISDEEVRGEIANILQQQGLVNPTTEQYKIWLTRNLHLSPREFEEGLREFMRIQKLLRGEIAGFAPAGIEKLPDPKAKEEAAAKQRTSFMTWTNEVNKRAALKDYLTLPQTPEEAPAMGTASAVGAAIKPAETKAPSPIKPAPAPVAKPETGVKKK